MKTWNEKEREAAKSGRRLLWGNIYLTGSDDNVFVGRHRDYVLRPGEDWAEISPGRYLVRASAVQAGRVKLLRRGNAHLEGIIEVSARGKQEKGGHDHGKRNC